jgi:NitT/TauT family transport system substrate-binding protein
MLKRLSELLALAALIVISSTAVFADKTALTVSTQLGINYLPMLVMKHHRLLEKHAEALGLGTISVTFVMLGGGSATNDALLSGSVDVVATGVPPIIQIWSASSGGGSAVKAIGALGSLPFLLNTANPNVRTISDFNEQDRIAVPAAKVGLQATLLQMQCAKLFGLANFAKLDHLTISMAHPDALAALLSGSRGSITAHFGQSPFQEEELKNAKVHTVLTSHDVLDGPATSELLATTVAFRDANPILYKAIFASLDETIRTINSDKRKAAQIYVEEAQSKDAADVIEKIISAPQVEYSVVPNGIMKYADFMHKVGRIKRRPEKWSDLFFPEIHDRPGS